MERRHYRRAELDVPVAIHPLKEGGTAQTERAITGQIKNLSLAGLYCYTKAPCPLKAGEQVACAIAIPREQARFFPFTRLTGKGWVVRTESVPMGRRAGESQSEEELMSVAVAFTQDVTALGAVES